MFLAPNNLPCRYFRSITMNIFLLNMVDGVYSRHAVVKPRRPVYRRQLQQIRTVRTADDELRTER